MVVRYEFANRPAVADVAIHNPLEAVNPDHAPTRDRRTSSCHPTGGSLSEPPESCDSAASRVVEINRVFTINPRHAATRVGAFLRHAGVRHRAFVVVCIAGLAARAVLIPTGHGQDFTVWQLASDATLHGVNVYAHHPAYPGGPYAYFPLFLYIELPMRWLSQHTAMSFVVLGKLPIAASDFGVTALLYRLLIRRGNSPFRAAIGAALYLLNPLVLYNGAFYGRFDAMACAFLLMVTAAQPDRFARGTRRCLWYALAIAAKTFPLFVAPAILRAAGRRRRRTVVVTLAVLLVLSAPYLVAPWPYLHDIALYDAAKSPTGLSWWTVLNSVCSPVVAGSLSGAGLVAFLAGAILIARRVRTDQTVAVAATLLLFVLCNKVVLEQYLTWPMPWLIIIAMRGRRRLPVASAVMLALLTSAGIMDSESLHPLGRDSPLLGILVALASAAYVLIVWRTDRMHPEIAPLYDTQISKGTGSTKPDRPNNGRDEDRHVAAETAGSLLHDPR